jgi:hypothetical protein
MATPQLSPGTLIREVDLTVGRADNVLDNIGAIAGPFSIGPVNQAIDITTEQELIDTFGKPISSDRQFEYWMSASSFLSYGGILKVVRVDDSNLRNSRVGYNTTATVKITNFDDYNSQTTGAYHFAARTPGTWANGLKVCVIDDKADQIIGLTTTNPGAIGAQIGFGVSVGINTIVAGSGTTSSYTGYLKGIIVGVNTGITTTSSTIEVKILSRVSTGGTETLITYSEGSEYSAIVSNKTLTFISNSGVSTGSQITASSVLDWYNEQTLGLSNSTIYWRSIAPKPITTQYALTRNCNNDALNIAIVDDTGYITGVQGNLLEKHVGISKATDAISGVNSPQKVWYRNYLANFSSYVYSGTNYYTSADTVNNITPVPGGFTTYSGIPSASFSPVSISNGSWNQNAQNITFNVIGNQSFTLSAGADYTGNGSRATLGGLVTAYNLFANEDEVEVDYLIGGPGLDSIEESQAKANQLISIAESRKDCVAVISPHRAGVVDITNTTTQTNNIIQFFSPLSSSSYAIFDSGYKYTFDRFNNLFRYIPCNADIAGLMSRTNINAYPWFSPAGLQRGLLNNAIKLSYNPTKSQRDLLYQARINPIINQPGSGVVLFGDKTALAYSSAFDRINVRRLFLTVEQALKRSSQSQLFELNNQTTRSNFVNTVEPYLRDVQAKNGIYDYLVICDESNNTPDIIDNNEFRADIFLKPTRSINYITLTFVATRTGISFEEVAGRV